MFTEKQFVQGFHTFKYGYFKQIFLPLEKESIINLTFVINDKGIWFDIQLNPDIEFISKAVDFYHLQNIWAKFWSVNKEKGLLTAQKNQ